MKRCSLLSLFTFLLISSLFGQESGGVQEVRVGGINFFIGEEEEQRAGLTREKALRKFFQMKIGDVYESPEKLEKELERITQDLNSQQVFKEISFEVSYWKENLPLFPRESLGAHISIHVEDSFSLYLLPSVTYDSNLGMLYGGNFAYNNAFGTLTNFNLKGYGGTETWKVGGTWENVPIHLFRADLALSCEEVTTRRVDDNDNTVLEYSNLLLDFNMRVDFPIVGGWELLVKPGIYLPFNYELDYYDDDYGRGEFDELATVSTGTFTWGISHTDYFWEENFRVGIESELAMTLEGDLSSDWEPLLSLEAGSSAFYRPLPFLGMGHHVSGFYVVDGIREEAGVYIRGVLDYLMYGEWGIFLNNNIDVRAFTIPPVLELHVYPLFDLGMVYNDNTPYDPYDYRMTAGFGLTLFPLFLQSLQMNIEYGYDLINKGTPELTIKSELFF